MCGRSASTLPAEQIARLFRTGGATPNAPARWTSAPTQTSMVISRHPESGARQLDMLSWGLVPHFPRDLKTARRPITRDPKQPR